MTDIVIVLTTVPSEAADEVGEQMARALVADGLAACVNVTGPMSSTYRWKGRVERAIERQLIIKTTRHHVEAVQVRLLAMHPYEMPELLVLDVADGSRPYLDWVRDATRADSEPRG